MSGQQISEADWHILTRLKPEALDRLCSRILKKATKIAEDETQGNTHERYLKLYRHINNSDKDVARCFNDWRRSDAFIILANWKREKLVTDQEFGTFSESTRNSVNLIVSIR